MFLKQAGSFKHRLSAMASGDNRDRGAMAPWNRAEVKTGRGIDPDSSSFSPLTAPQVGRSQGDAERAENVRTEGCCGELRAVTSRRQQLFLGEGTAALPACCMGRREKTLPRLQIRLGASRLPRLWHQLAAHVTGEARPGHWRRERCFPGTK